jgi:hypothetical protein
MRDHTPNPLFDILTALALIFGFLAFGLNLIRGGFLPS